jgi:hypothetical protein
MKTRAVFYLVALMWLGVVTGVSMLAMAGVPPVMLAVVTTIIVYCMYMFVKENQIKLRRQV